MLGYTIHAAKHRVHKITYLMDRVFYNVLSQYNRYTVIFHRNYFSQYSVKNHFSS